MIVETLGAVFPDDYSIDAPVAAFQLAEVAAEFVCAKNIPSLRASDQAVEFARQWLADRAAGRKAVSITLREAPYGIERNSDLDQWGAFARHLLDNDFFPVILRDTYAACDPPPAAIEAFSILEEASFNIELRMALYQECYVNLFTNGGPQVLCHLNQATRCLVFKPMVESWHDSTAFGLRRGVGVEIGENPCFLPELQKWVWKPDTFDAINEAFEHIVCLIEGAGGPAELNAAKEFFPANNDTPERLLKNLEETSSWPAAARILGHLLENTPDDAVLHRRLAVARTWTKQSELAGVHFAKAEELGGADPILYSAMGDHLVLRGKAQDAIIMYRRSLDLDENYAKPYVSLGMLMEAIGNSDEAINLLERALELTPGDATIMRLLARNLAQAGRNSEAQTYDDEAERISPKPKEDSL